VVDVFGPIFVAAFLEQAVIDTLKIWLPLYIKEIELQLGRTPGELPPPKSYTTRRRFDKFPEDQLPTIIVVSPGLDDDPNEEGDGNYRAPWRMHVGAVVSTSDPAATNLVAKIMGAAIRGAMVQHKSLGGVASGLTWYDESYDDLPDDDVSRSLGATSLSFRIEVDDVVNWQRGPDGSYLPDPTATTPPGGIWPTADTVTVELEKEAL
jgi:hypothetical protein